MHRKQSLSPGNDQLNGIANDRPNKTTNLPLLMRFSFLMPLKELVRLYHAANDDTRRSGLGTIIQIRFNCQEK